MRTFTTIALIVFFAFSTPTFVSAQTVTSGGGSNQTVTSGGGSSSGSNVTLINPLKAQDLEAFLKDILAFIIRIGTIVVILMIVYVGYLFVVAQGVPGKIEEARKALLWTVVGALILLGSQAIAISLEATVRALSG